MISLACSGDLVEPIAPGPQTDAVDQLLARPIEPLIERGDQLRRREPVDAGDQLVERLFHRVQQRARIEPGDRRLGGVEGLAQRREFDIEAETLHRGLEIVDRLLQRPRQLLGVQRPDLIQERGKLRLEVGDCRFDRRPQIELAVLEFPA